MSLINPDERNKRLVAELYRREREVFDYQIEIDSLDLAVQKLADQHPDMEAAPGHTRAFHSQLVNLAAENRRQQERSQLMLDVVREQLEGVDISQYQDQVE